MFVLGIILFFIIIILNVYVIFFGFSPVEMVDKKFLEPNNKYFMGTDQLGRDVFSRVIVGSKSSLSIAFIAVVIASSVGSSLGVYAGYFAGNIDRVLSVIFDALYAFPGIIFAILISVMFGRGIYTTAFAISIGYIPQYFRVVRGISLSVKERPFIEALRSIGAKSRTIIFQHLIVYAIPSIIALIVLNMGSAILAVSGLGFLGLGLPPPKPELGTDLGRGRDFITRKIWWTSVFPGLMILIIVLSFTLLGEGLNEILSAKISDVRA
jgi:peptide/nickel transport system permease protein